jgi:hypothetical protein
MDAEDLNTYRALLENSDDDERTWWSKARIEHWHSGAVLCGRHMPVSGRS